MKTISVLSVNLPNYYLITAIAFYVRIKDYIKALSLIE